MGVWQRTVALVLVVITLSTAGFLYWNTTGLGSAPAFAVPAGTRQAIVLEWSHLFDGEKTTALSLWEVGDDGWKQVEGPIRCVIGRNRLALAGQKREGDGRTPSGTFRIGTAFGSEATIDTKLNYRLATADDFWVDDPASPEYNRWVHGKPEGKSFEKLLIDYYRYAAVIEYNTDPVVPGKGSAIFLHVWEGEHTPTSGCVAVQEADMKHLLAWLDKRKNPVIVLDPR
jgi:L,D-peptidoglycan transpeptidase YkuD (ErfK/YbiS/YcfS/YnhG family)